MKAGGDAAGGTQRVFVALWPTIGVRTRLEKVIGDVASKAPHARPMHAANLHLTLAFIGGLANERVRDLAARLDAIATSPFEWRVDRIGHFAGARVVWAGGPQDPALLRLAATARELLDALRIGYDRKPFAPHVTLLRNVARWPSGTTELEPVIPWPCKEAVLVRSTQGPQGVNYAPIELL